MVILGNRNVLNEKKEKMVFIYYTTRNIFNICSL